MRKRKRAKIFYDPANDFAEIVFLDKNGEETERKEVDPGMFILVDELDFPWAQLFRGLARENPDVEFLYITITYPDGDLQEYAPAPGGSWYVLT